MYRNNIKKCPNLLTHLLAISNSLNLWRKKRFSSIYWYKNISIQNRSALIEPYIFLQSRSRELRVFPTSLKTICEAHIFFDLLCFSLQPFHFSWHVVRDIKYWLYTHLFQTLNIDFKWIIIKYNRHTFYNFMLLLSAPLSTEKSKRFVWIRCHWLIKAMYFNNVHPKKRCSAQLYIVIRIYSIFSG